MSFEQSASARRVLDVDVNGHITDANLIKFDTDDSQPTYIGTNVDQAATDSDPRWLIYKFTYSGTAVTMIQKLKGTWTGRAALPWQ